MLEKPTIETQKTQLSNDRLFTSVYFILMAITHVEPLPPNVQSESFWMWCAVASRQSWRTKRMFGAAEFRIISL